MDLIDGTWTGLGTSLDINAKWWVNNSDAHEASHYVVHVTLDVNRIDSREKMSLEDRSLWLCEIDRFRDRWRAILVESLPLEKQSNTLIFTQRYNVLLRYIRVTCCIATLIHYVRNSSFRLIRESLGMRVWKRVASWSEMWSEIIMIVRGGYDDRLGRRWFITPCATHYSVINILPIKAFPQFAYRWSV